MPHMPYQHPPLGESWWARRWLSLLNELGSEYRGVLNRGRIAARDGEVGRAEVFPGHLSATVQGSFGIAFRVDMRMPILDGRAWERVLAALAGQAGFVARLLAGEMPREVEDIFAAAGATLFPSGLREVETTCGCLARGVICKHAAALHYFFAMNLDAQPFVLLALHGYTQQQIVAALRAEWADGDADDPVSSEAESNEDAAEHTVAPLRATSFFEAGAALDRLAFGFAPPQSDAALLQRLGRPPFATASEDVIMPLSAAYGAITRRALAALKQGGARRDVSRQRADQASTDTDTE
jgi:uncharacterized Zn finger protein